MNYMAPPPPKLYVGLLCGREELTAKGYRRCLVQFNDHGEIASAIQFGPAGERWPLVTHAAIWAVPVGGEPLRPPLPVLGLDDISEGECAVVKKCNGGNQ